MEREKALEMALGQIEKQFGKGSIMRMGENLHMNIEAISTGALALDLALGIGGLPRGRVVEVYGPESSGKSTLAMHVVAEAQRNGGICAYIDAEHAMDPVYAKAIGVNIDDLLISQPDTGEQALEITDTLVRSGAMDVIVIDSVAALTPRAEIEGEMGDSHVGLQARLMSQALRKLTGNLSRSNTIALFINQLREKIGVMYGCFSYDTRVSLADGTQEKIGKIVNQKLPVEVLSYDADKGAIVPKKVVNWFDNGRTDQFLRFCVDRPAGNGRSQFAATSNHLIRTPGGWREAGELKAGDRVLQMAPVLLSDFQTEVIRGGLMGDACLSKGGNGISTRARWTHGPRQIDYGKWKASLFSNIGTTTSAHAKGGIEVSLTPLSELAALGEDVYVGSPTGLGAKRFSEDYLKQVGPLGLAFWYQDDFGFTIRSKGLQSRTSGLSGRAAVCVEAMDLETQVRVTSWLRETWGIEGRVSNRGANGQAVLTLTTDGTAKLHALIAPFVHPSMDYKLLPRFRGRFQVDPVFAPPRTSLVPALIRSIQAGPPNGRRTHRFDIEVEGTHNYFVDGVMVHNSPEVTPGGRALKFYSSVRLDIRRIESIKDGAEVVGNRTRVKVVKNKCVAAGTRVFDPSTGLTHRIEDVVEHGVGASVMAADKSGRLHIRPIVGRMDQGEFEVIGLRLRDGTDLWVTKDHKVMTDRGWRQAGELSKGDLLARPRRALAFGQTEPVSPAEARMLGYLIGDGCVTGKTPISFTNIQDDLQADAASIASSLGCDAYPRGIQVSFSHRRGEKNRLLELCRRMGIWGYDAPQKKVPAPFFDPDISSEVLGNLLFGIWESYGWVSREQTGGLRLGFVTTCEQLAHQLHWLLLRFGIGSGVRVYDPKSKRPSVVKGRKIQGRLPCWEVRISGIENVARFAESIPMWGPKGRAVTAALADPAPGKHRGSQRGYLPPSQTEPVLAYLRGLGVTPTLAAQLVGEGAGDPGLGFRGVLGAGRLRRDRVERLASALQGEFLQGVLDEDLWYDRVVSISEPEWRRIYDIEVEEHHTFVANDIVVSNCAPPFKQAEFDIGYGHGISREGSLLDVGVDLGFIKKAGAWFTYEGEQLGQGRENAKQFLTDHPEVMIEINEKIRNKVRIGEGGGVDDIPLGQGEDDDAPIMIGD